MKSFILFYIYILKVKFCELFTTHTRTCTHTALNLNDLVPSVFEPHKETVYDLLGYVRVYTYMPTAV